MTTRRVVLHTRCAIPECGKVLLSIAEGERGTCLGCWAGTLSPAKRQAIDALLTIIRSGGTEDEQDEAGKVIARIHMDELQQELLALFATTIEHAGAVMSRKQ
jgi:hypothetical protein